MRDEIAKARAQATFYSIPHREKPDEPPVSLAEMTARRRSLRMVTDDLVHAALLNGDVATLMNSICETMTAVGGTCAGLGIEPDVNDLLLAAKDLVEDVRVLIDRGIGVKEYDQIKIGCAMMEAVCIGISAVLGLPYREAMQLAHEKYMNAETPGRDDFVALLIRHGFMIDERGADNDEAA